MINYELAKELKDNGFPQNPEDLLNEIEYGGKNYSKPTEPTLSELIEACGEDFWSLERDYSSNTYIAKATWFPSGEKPSWGHGPTSEEAVAKLWLALNGHK